MVTPSRDDDILWCESVIGKLEKTKREILQLYSELAVGIVGRLEFELTMKRVCLSLQADDFLQIGREADSEHYILSPDRGSLLLQRLFALCYSQVFGDPETDVDARVFVWLVNCFSGLVTE